MKKILAAMFVVLMTNAYADIEYEGKENNPTPQEISKNRACFEELAKQGCGDPGDDVKQFRSCLHNVFPTLGSDCQKLMIKLYTRQ